MRRALPPLSAVLLALCCVLAGCNAFAPDAADTTDAPVVTPADVPRDMHGGTLAPGLTDQRIVDPRALLDAHRSVVDGRPVTVGVRTRVTDGDGSTVTLQNATYRYRANRSVVAIDGRFQGQTPERISVWANGTASLYRYGDDDPRYRVVDRGGYVEPDTLLQSALAFDDDDASGPPVETEYLGRESGYATYRVTVETNDDRTVENAFVVDERGFVSEVYRERVGGTTPAVGPVDDGSMRTVSRFAVAEAGVGRPDWVGDARETIANREYVAPGVTTERIVDSGALVDAHRTVLGNTSATYVSESREVAANGTVLRDDRRTVRVAADRSRYHVVDVRGTDDGTVREERWSNGSVGYTLSERGDARSYDRTVGDSWRRLPDPDLVRSVEVYDATVTETGDGRYRVTVDGYDPRPVGAGPGEQARDVTLVAVVDERGFVSSAERRYRVDDRTVVDRRRYVDVGETEVPRPDWLADAANETDGANWTVSESATRSETVGGASPLPVR